MSGTLKSRMSAGKENTQYWVIMIINKLHMESFWKSLYNQIFQYKLKIKYGAKSGIFGLPRMRMVMPLKTAPTYVSSHITTASWKHKEIWVKRTEILWIPF